MSQQDIQFKAIPGQFNIDEAQGVVECFVAGIGNKDSVGDVLITGAFTKSLTRRKPRVVWGHNWNDPIGKVLEIYEVAPGDRRLPSKMLNAGIGGLYARVQFNLNSEKGREAFANVAFFGQEQEWSIGYKTLDSIFDPNIQANILKEVELYEVSPVLHGANQLTGTISVKSDETAEKHMPGMMMPHHEGMGAGPKIVVVRQSNDDDDDKPIFSEGLAQALGDNEKERLTRELQARSGSSIQLVSATESTAKFRRMTSDGRSVMYRIGYHTPDNYVTFMFGKPELAESQQPGGSRTVVPSQMPSMPMQVKPRVTTDSTNYVVSPEYVMPKGEDYEKSAFDEELENLAQILDETFDVKVGRTLSSRNMSKLKTVLETLQDIVSSAEKDVESKSDYIIPVKLENAFETKQLLDPIFDYHRVESHVTEDGIVITTGVTQEFIEAIGVAEKALGRTLSGGLGKLGRAGRGAVNFDPKAWDGDGDGIVQEGTPYSRPAIPGVNDRASGGRVDATAATRAWQNQRRAGMASRTGRMDADDNFDEYDEAMGPPMRRAGRGMAEDPTGDAASENLDRDRNAGAVRRGLSSSTPKPRKKSTDYKKDKNYTDLDDDDKKIVDVIQEAIENGEITGESYWSDWVSNTLGDWSLQEQYEAIYGRSATSEDFQESADQSGSRYRDGEGRYDDDIEEEFYSESIADASPREKLIGLVGEYMPEGSKYGDKKHIAALRQSFSSGRSGLSSSTSGSRGKPEPLKREGEFHGGNIYDEFNGQYVEGEVVALSDLYGDDRPGYGIVGRYDSDGSGTVDYFYGGTDDEEFETIEDAIAFLENVENEAENDRFYNEPEFRSVDRKRSAGRPGERPLAGFSSSTAEVVSKDDLPKELVNDVANAAVRAVGRSGDETRLIDGAKEVLANLTSEKLKDSVGKSISNARKRLAEMLSDEKVIEEFQSRKAIEDFMDEVGYAVQEMLDLHVGSVKKNGTSVEKEEIEEIVDNAKSKFDNDFNELVKASKEFWNKRRKPGRLDGTPEEAKKEAAIDRKNLMETLREGGEPEDLESTLGSIFKMFDNDSEKIISGTISVEDLNYLTEKALDQIIENDPSIDPEELVNEFAEALREGASKDGANPLIVALAKEFGDEKITGGDLIDYLNDTRQNSVYRPDRGKIEKEKLRGFASRVGNNDPANTGDGERGLGSSSDKREMDMTLAEYAELDKVLKKYMDDSQVDGIGADEDMQVIQDILDKLDESSAANDSIPLTDKEIDDYMDTLTRMRDNGPVEDLADKESIDKLIDSLKKTKESTDGTYESDALQQAGTRLTPPPGGRGRTTKGTRPFKSSNGTINPHKKLDFELEDSEIGELRDELDGFMKMTNNPGPLRAVAEKLEKATNGKFSLEKEEYEEVVKEIEKLRTDKKIVTSDVIGLLEQAAESKKGKYSSIEVNGGRGFSSSTGGGKNNGAPSDIPETMQKQLLMWARQQRGLRLAQESVEKFDRDKGTLPASHWRRLRTLYENMGPGSASGAARSGGRRGIFGRGKDTSPTTQVGRGPSAESKPLPQGLLDNTMSKNPIVTDGFTDMRSGSMGGSQGGGVFKDPKTGQEYYIKPAKTQTHAENESLMSRLYERIGIPVAKVKVGTYKGRPKIVSIMIPGAEKVNHESEMKKPAWKKAVQDTFVANAWLANWDAVSNGGNTIRGGDGNAYVVDVGGAGLFRARGEAKGSAFGPIVGEMESLRDPKQDGAQRGVAYWGDIPPAEIARQVKVIGAISDSEIKQMVDALISDKGEAKKLSDTLIARRDYLVQNWSTGKNSGSGRRGRTGFSSRTDPSDLSDYRPPRRTPGGVPAMRPADFEVRADSEGVTGVGKGGAMGTKPDKKFSGDSFDQVKPDKWDELTIDEKWEWMLGEGNPEKGGTMSPAAYEGAMKKLGDEEAREEAKRMSPEERRKARTESRESQRAQLSDNEKERISAERAKRQADAESQSKRVKEEATAEKAQAKRQALLDGFNEWIDDSVRQLSEMEYDGTDINPDADDIWDTVSTILGVNDITPKSLNEAIEELSSYVDVNSPGENAYEKKSIARANALLKKLSKMKSEYSEDKWFNGREGRRSGFDSRTGGRPRPGTPEMPQSNAKREGDIKRLSTLIEQVVAELEAKRQNPSPKKGRMGFSSSTGKTMITDEATFFKDIENSLAKEIRAAQKAKNTKAITGLTKLQEIIKRNEASKTGDRRTNVGSIYMTMDEVDLILDGLQFALDQQVDAGGDKRIGWYSKLIEKIAAAAMSTFIDKSTTEIGSTRRTVTNKDGVKKKINIVPEA